jgi:predicted nucleotidyltransferase
MRPTKEQILHRQQELKPKLLEMGIERVALFGSFAKGEETLYSDIDIAIKKSRPMSAYDYFDTIDELRSLLMRTFHRPVDIFDLDSASSIKKHIASELIYV